MSESLVNINNMSFTNMTSTASSGDFDEIKQIALSAQAIASSNQSLIATKAIQSDVTASLSLKQNVIADGDLQISHVSNLLANLNLKADLQTVTSSLNTKQPNITNDSLTIARTVGLQAALDSKIEQGSLTSSLALKQDSIGADGLEISNINGLQGALSSSVNASDVYTKGEIETFNNSKQDTIGVNDLEIGNVNNLLVTLNSKASNSSLLTALSTKHPVITAGSLAISDTNEVQTSLNSKANSSDILTSLQITNLINTKQTVLDQLNTSTDSSVHRILYTSGVPKMSSIFGESGILVTRSMIPGNTSDARHLQLKIAPSSEIQALPQRVTDVEADISTVTTALTAEQYALQDGDLSVAKTASLQDILDTKVESSQIYTQAQTNSLLSTKQSLLVQTNTNTSSTVHPICFTQAGRIKDFRFTEPTG